MADTHNGTCFCGAVEIEAVGAPVEMGYCHCADCRAYSGAPLVAFSLWPADAVRITLGAELVGRVNKRGFSERQFCTRCGGHLLAEHPGWSFTDVPAGRLPTLDFRPTVHLNYASTVLPMKDGLPKLRDFPVEAGGSGETIPE
jgi:hypothetical protein